MARFLEMIEAIFEKKEQNREALINDSGPYPDLRTDPDFSSLEQMENDMQEIVDDLWILIHSPAMPSSWKTKLERMRYKLATYLPNRVCCVCGESPSTWSENGDGWYCERCVKREN